MTSRVFVVLYLALFGISLSEQGGRNLQRPVLHQDRLTIVTFDGILYQLGLILNYEAERVIASGAADEGSDEMLHY